MFRALPLLAAAACAHGVSRPNPPAPVENRGVPYAGRIVLVTPELRERVDAYADAWTRRLGILGFEARVTYDDERAVFDIYGTPPDTLPAIAALLADRGAWYLDGKPHDGALVTWLGPTPDCDCSGRVRVQIDRVRMCELLSGEHELVRLGATLRLRGKVYWRLAKRDLYVDRPPGYSRCATEDYWPDNIVFELPPHASPTQRRDIVLALAGGSLPDAPRIAAVTRGAP